MNMQIADATDRVWTFRRDVCNAIGNAGYGDLHLLKPYVAIRHVLGILKPHQLYKGMADLISWRKDEYFEKENFDRFMQEASKQVEKIQVRQNLCPEYLRDKALNTYGRREQERFKLDKARNSA